jgi:hypothetical protein
VFVPLVCQIYIRSISENTSSIGNKPPLNLMEYHDTGFCGRKKHQVTFFSSNAPHPFSTREEGRSIKPPLKIYCAVDYCTVQYRAVSRNLVTALRRVVAARCQGGSDANANANATPLKDCKICIKMLCRASSLTTSGFYIQYKKGFATLTHSLTHSRICLLPKYPIHFISLFLL